MSFLPVLRNISSTRPQGPSRTFTELQVIRTILILGERKVLGRTLLSRLLNTGSGAIRTLINDLEVHDIIRVERTGCMLTKKGQDIHRNITEKILLIDKIDAGRLSVADYDAAVIVKNASKLIHRGIEQRDAAIRVGAKGATTLIYEDGKFVIPMGSLDCAKEFPSNIWNVFETTLNLVNGDVIIVSSADEKEVAVYGVLAGALTLAENN